MMVECFSVRQTVSRIYLFRFKGRNQNTNKSGDNSREDTPVPISNTEVKLLSADDTWWEAAWESRTLPVFYYFNFRDRDKKLSTAARHVLLFSFFVFIKKKPGRIGKKTGSD